MDNIEFTTSIIGCQYIYLPQCHSTNDYALLMARKNDAKEGCIVNTGNQTMGRGQRGSVWLSEPNQNLTFSIVLKPSFVGLSQQFILNMIVSLGIMDTLKVMLPLHQFKIKWPNDIYVYHEENWKKLGGILIENVINGTTLINSVVGIGLNINQTVFDIPSAISIKSILNTHTDPKIVLLNIAKYVEHYYLKLKNNELDYIRYAYTQQLYAYGEYHQFDIHGSRQKGIVLGVGDNGMLAIQFEKNIHYYNIKEVKFIFD